MTLYVVLENGDPRYGGVFTKEWEAQNFINDCCDVDDRGERFTIQRFDCGTDVTVQRHTAFGQ
jgi:hypothetical protein